MTSRDTKAETIRRLATVERAAEVPEHDDSTDISVTRFLASDDTLDRWGTRIVQDWMEDGRIEPFLGNPVIAHGHDYRKPAVGRAEDLRVAPHGNGMALFLSVRWDMDDEDAAKLAGKYARGIMHAGSVGFRSEHETRLSELPEEHPWHADRGWRLSGNHLLEFSVGVMVPGNANALAIRSGDDDTWLRDAVMMASPADVRDIVSRLLREDKALRSLVHEVANDIDTTAEHAAEVVRRNATGPLSWLIASK